MNSTTAILREMDKNMQNHSVYTYIDSKIVLKKSQENEYHRSQGKGYLCGKGVDVMKRRWYRAPKVELRSIAQLVDGYTCVYFIIVLYIYKCFIYSFLCKLYSTFFLLFIF